MKQSILTYVKTRLPSGIRLHKDNTMIVDVSKQVEKDGKKKLLRISKTIKLGIPEGVDDVTAKSLFEKALNEAVMLKLSMQKQVATNGYAQMYEQKKVGTATLGGIWQNYYLEEANSKAEQHTRNIVIYYNDIVEFFSSDKKLNSFTYEELDSFKLWLRDKIIQRQNNSIGTASSSSINKRLGVIRELVRLAIKHRLMNYTECLNPNPSIKNLGIEDLPRGESTPKPVMSLREQEKFIETIEQSGDEVFADMMTWAFHTGMRHSTELNKFTIHNINFVNHTIQFYREKTKKMSVVFPLSKRCIEIAKKYREVALAREDGKVFPFGKQYIRTRWAKYVKECGLNNTYTPYVTRHTFITRLVEEGVSDRVISDLAGHTCMETTSKYYKKSTSKLLTNAVLSLDNARDEYLDSKNSMIGHNSNKRKVENE